MSTNSFTIYVKSAAQTIAGPNLFHGFSMAISQDGQGTDVDEMGVLVSGNPPQWFRGIVSYGDTSGWLILTNRSEGVLTNATDYFTLAVDGGTPISIGADTWQELDTNGHFQGRYYADVDANANQLKAAATSGATVKLEISVINDSEFDDATDIETNCSYEITQPMGHDAESGMYRDIIQ